MCVVFEVVVPERRGGGVVSTPAWHAGGSGFDAQAVHVILCVETWLSTLQIVYLCGISDETKLTSVGPFYPLSLPGEVKYPTQGVNV